MPDLQTNLSDDQAAADADPLAKLHKMSTTAGLGSGDYVAINIVAVVTALLGVASVLSKLAEALLIIPLVGVICGIVALRQIAKSNGTQTGKGVAWLGLLLSIGIGGWVFALQSTELYRTKEDQDAIAALVKNFGEALKAGDLDKAYTFFDQDFKDLTPIDKFKSRLAFFQTPQAAQLYGHLTSIEWNGHLQFDQDVRTGMPIAGGIVLMNFDKKSDALRQGIAYHKIGSTWKIDAIPELFPPPAKPGAAPGQ